MPPQFYFLCVAILFCWSSTTVAYPPSAELDEPAATVEDPTRLTLERIFQSSEFRAESKSFRWHETAVQRPPSGEASEVLLSKRSKKDSGPAIVQIDVPGLEERVLIGPERFPAVEEESAAEPDTESTDESDSSKSFAINDYAVSDDQRYLLVFTNSKRVWRQNSIGDYWLLDRDTQVWRQVGGPDVQPQTLMFATFAPDNTSIAFVRDQGLYLEDVQTGDIRAIAASDNPDLIQGTFDWVYEEELSLRNGFRFSPNGSKLAFWQVDTSDVPRHTLIDNTTARYPQLKQFAYPKVGQTNSAVTLAVFDRATGKTTSLQIPGDTRNHYPAAMHWVPAENPGANQRLLVQQLNRKQNQNRLWLVDVDSGNAKEVLRESSSGWLMHQSELHWLKNDPASNAVELIWLSERTGWQHLSRLSIPTNRMSGSLVEEGNPKQSRVAEIKQPTGGNDSDSEELVALAEGVTLKAISQGQWDVISIDAVDSERQQVYITASPGNPSARGLYRVSLNEPAGSGEDSIVRISPPGRGSYSYQISPSCEFAVETWSDFSTPPVKRLVRLSPAYERLHTIVENESVRQAIAELLPVREEFVQLAIDDDVSLEAWIMLPNPPTAASGTSMPLVIHVYGEPAGQTVRDSFGGSSYLWHRMLTQQGFAVASIDNRGTKSPRGRAFRQSVYKQIGIISPQDQAAGLKRLLARFPQLDPRRVGIWGWSGGGTSSLHAVFRYPDLYAAAIAIAPVSEQMDYDTIYQERYMGLLDENRDNYIEGSPITHADGLADPLLLVHGTGDDNVHYASTERLINRLIAAEKPFEMMFYPGRTHSVSEGKGTTLHLRRLMTDFLKRNLSK